jgi:virginiamycin B lyase
VSATPSPGATLTTAPALVRLEFTEPVNPSFSGMTITGPDGIVRTTARFPSSDARAMEAGLPAMPPGRYSVEWHTLSLIDGHTRSGAYSFGILDAAGKLPPAPPLTIHSAAAPLPGWLDAAARWALLLAIAYLLGGLAYATLVEPRRGASPRAGGGPGGGSVDLDPGTSETGGIPGWGRVRVVGRRGATVAAAVGIAGLAESVASSAAGSEGLATIPQVATGSFAGQASLIMVLAIVVLAWSATRPAGRRALAGWAAGVIALVALAATSHVAAGPGSAWGTLAMAVHAGTALTWTGGLFHLARAWLRPESASGPGTPPAGPAARLPRADLLARFSRLAGPSVALVLGSGLIAALVVIPDPGAPVSTAYGRVLVVKAAIVALLLVPAGLNALRRPSSAWGPKRTGPGPWRIIGAELVLAVAAIGAGAVLGGTTPAAGEIATRSAQQAIAANDNPANLVSSTVDAGGTVIAVNIVPGEVGTNQVDVDVPIRPGAPVPVRVQLVDPAGNAGPTLALVPGSREQSDAGPTQAYDAFVELGPVSGTWTARLTLAAGGATSEVAVPVPLTGLVPPPAAANSDPLGSPAPDVPPQLLLALALATLAAAVVAYGRASPRTLAWHAAPPIAGVGFGAVVLLLGSLAAGVQAPSGAPGSPPAPWGVASKVVSATTGGVSEYAIPTPRSGLMIPAVAPDGHVWVGEMDGNRIAELDPASGVVRELVLAQPIRSVMGLAVGPDGHIWWAEEATDQVGMLDPATGTVREYPLLTAHAGPVGIAVAPSGAVYVTEQAAGRIAVLDPTSGTVREYPIPTPDSIPYWIALAPDGRAWFTEMDGKAVGVLDPGTGAIREYRGAATQGEPVGIAVARTGIVWFSTLDGVLGRLDPGTGSMSTIRLGAGTAGYGVAIDDAGRVWVGELGDALARFDPATGTAVQVRMPAAGSGPWWPAMSPDGRVWVAEGALDANRLARLAP